MRAPLVVMGVMLAVVWWAAPVVHADTPRHGFDACQPVTYATPAGSPTWLTDALRRATGQWAAATGMDLRVDTHGVGQVVTLAWASPARLPLLAGPVLSVTIPTGTQDRTIVAGRILLDRADLNAWRTRRGPADARRVVVTLLRHEVGHSLGLPEATRGVMRPALDLTAHLTAREVTAVHRLSPPCPAGRR